METVNRVQPRASTVAKLLTEELRKIKWGSETNPRTRYVDKDWRVKRDTLIKDPVANLIMDGRRIVINYAPHRDEGRHLPIDVAREYLFWLQDGGSAPHWVFFQETGRVNL